MSMNFIDQYNVDALVVNTETNMVEKSIKKTGDVFWLQLLGSEGNKTFVMCLRPPTRYNNLYVTFESIIEAKKGEDLYFSYLFEGLNSTTSQYPRVYDIIDASLEVYTPIITKVITKYMLLVNELDEEKYKRICAWN